MGQVPELWLSCYLGLLSIDSKPGNKTAVVSWPDLYTQPGCIFLIEYNRDFRFILFSHTVIAQFKYLLMKANTIAVIELATPVTPFTNMD